MKPIREGVKIIEKNIRVIIGLNDNFELFIRDIERGQEIDLCRYDTEMLLELLSEKYLKLDVKKEESGILTDTIIDEENGTQEGF